MATTQGFARAIVAFAAAAALGGCADRFERGDEAEVYDGLPTPRAYPYAYGYDDAYAEAPPYLEYPEYYDALYPLYASYYDPWINPGFYYGVTWFPRTWFGIGYASPFIDYSPYPFAPWDGYFFWRPVRHAPRFGSASNEAERLSHLTRPLPTIPGRERDPGSPPMTSIRARDAAWREAAVREAAERRREAVLHENPQRERAGVRTIASPMARERQEQSGWIAPAPGSAPAGPAAAELSRIEPGVEAAAPAAATPYTRERGAGAAEAPAASPRPTYSRAEARSDAAAAPAARAPGPASLELRSMSAPRSTAPVAAPAPDSARFAPRTAPLQPAPAAGDAVARPRFDAPAPPPSPSPRERSEGREGRDRERER